MNSTNMEPQAQDSVPTSPNEASGCPGVQTPQEAHTLALHHLPSDIAVEFPSSSRQPQRKRKRDPDAGPTTGTGEEEPRACKRPRKGQVKTLSEERQRNAQQARQNEHEQPHAQPQPRRSTRIWAMNGKKDAAPPMAEIPVKLTGRKRTVRKK